ncbi:pilus assembly protein TadB [Massilia eurypsychrophila]|uniref:Pilus assembly protein TadB n=1 Tax=Massilia eurypsychrophila TaxID=1485217 RepID=A0A2G8TN47_9BURK|nr:type II secretion system F family protein [Massilia eurypsychrophila]PIL47018.1 pilus assembly protein TadB [Massilia eurypsychrophila]
MDALFYGFAVLTFAAVILIIEGAYLWWTGAHGSAARRISRRLRLMSGGMEDSGERVSILKQRRYARSEWLDRRLHRLRAAHTIDRLLLQSGLKWSVERFLGATGLALVVALALGVLQPMPGAVQLLLTLLLVSMPVMFLRRARTARLRRIERQLPEAADFLARAMRAGHSFNNVMQMVGNELPEPLSGEFRTAHQEINYGVPMNEALHNLAERVPLTDLRYLVIAVVIQRESGGNLAEILGNISHIIRERLKLAGKVRVLSAEGRLSAWILASLPFVMMGVMMLVNRGYVSTLWTHPLGIRMLWVGTVMIILGGLWTRRIVRIRV